MPDASPLFRLAEYKLEGSSLRDFVTECRRKNMSWRIVSRELYNATGVDVSDVSLRKWFLDTEAVA